MEVTLQSELTVSTMDVLSLQRWPEESESIKEAWYIYFNIWCDIIVYYNSLSSLTFRRRSSCSSFTPPPTCPLLLHRACFQPRFSHLNPSPYDEHVALLDAASGKPAHLQMCLGFFFYAWLPAGQRGIILCPTRQAAYSGSHRWQATQRKKEEMRAVTGLGLRQRAGEKDSLWGWSGFWTEKKDLICQRPPKCNVSFLMNENSKWGTGIYKLRLSE